LGNENFPLFVDPRVGSIDLVKFLKMPAQVTKLKYGDAAFMGNGPDDSVLSIGIERKNIRDLIQSMESGRLSGHQLIGLLDFYHVVYLVIEGTWQVMDGVVKVPQGRKWVAIGGTRHSWTYAEVANYLNTLAIITGVNMWFTEDPALTADWIRHTYFWWQKMWSEHKAHLDFSKPPDMPKHMRMIRPTLVHRIAKELRGIGWERAGELAREFPTMEMLMAAKQDDLIKLPGIGPDLAKSVFQELHRT
jgi:ERCC4-type nuclease